MIYGLSELSSAGVIGAAGTLLPLGGRVLIVVFVMHALSTARPLIDMRLFMRRSFSSAAATPSPWDGDFGSLLLIPLYLQSVRHESVLDTGLLTAAPGRRDVRRRARSRFGALQSPVHMCCPMSRGAFAGALNAGSS